MKRGMEQTTLMLVIAAIVLAALVAFALRSQAGLDSFWTSFMGRFS